MRGGSDDMNSFYGVISDYKLLHACKMSLRQRQQRFCTVVGGADVE